MDTFLNLHLQANPLKQIRMLQFFEWNQAVNEYNRMPEALNDYNKYGCRHSATPGSHV